LPLRIPANYFNIIFQELCHKHFGFINLRNLRVVSYLKELPENFPGRAEENHKKVM
jgi:hypothetical protein